VRDATESPSLEPLAGYDVPKGCRDELLDEHGAPRPYAAPLMATLKRIGPRALSAAGHRRDRIFMQQGITFEVASTVGELRDRPFPLDLVPRVLPAEQWTTIKRGLAQRIRALNAFVDDVYHEHEIVRAGIIPWSLVVSRPSFARSVHGVRPPGGVYCHVSGCDLVRGGDGRWLVLEDNVRTASGISYVLENRVAMTAELLIALFVGLSVPVIGAGVALDRGASPPNTVLGFAILVGVGVAGAGWGLLGRRVASSPQAT